MELHNILNVFYTEKARKIKCYKNVSNYKWIGDRWVGIAGIGNILWTTISKEIIIIMF